jgi:hypothetical protein
MISNGIMLEDQDNLIEVEDRILLCLDSRTATIKNNGSYLSDVQFNFQEPFIQPKDAINIKCSVLSFTCPNSQYIINQTNNIFYITVIYNNNPQEYEIIIPQGNYNQTSFNTTFLTYLQNGCTIGVWNLTVNPNTYQYTLINSGYSFSINQSNYPIGNLNIISRIGDVMGFDNLTNYNSVLSGSTYTLTFPYPCNFGGLNNINIHFNNLKTRSFQYIAPINKISNFQAYNSNYTNDNIAVSVPVNCNPGDVIYFSKIASYEFLLKEEIFDNIHITLLDDLGNFINLNNQNWNMSIEFCITKLMRKKTRNFFEILKNPYPIYE